MNARFELGPLGYPISRDDFVSEGRELWHQTGFTPGQMVKKCEILLAALQEIKNGLADDRAYRDRAREALRGFSP